jgi:hypothetical protein
MMPHGGSFLWCPTVEQNAKYQCIQVVQNAKISNSSLSSPWAEVVWKLEFPKMFSYSSSPFGDIRDGVTSDKLSLFPAVGKKQQLLTAWTQHATDCSNSNAKARLLPAT